MRSFVQTLERMGYRTCGVFLLDSIFVSDSSKFIAGMLSCLSTMVQLGPLSIFAMFDVFLSANVWAGQNFPMSTFCPSAIF